MCIGACGGCTCTCPSHAYVWHRNLSTLLGTPFPNPLTEALLLTWIGEAEPRCSRHDFPSGVSPGLVAIHVCLTREDVCQREEVAQQPDHRDGQDDLGRRQAQVTPAFHACSVPAPQAGGHLLWMAELL